MHSPKERGRKGGDLRFGFWPFNCCFNFAKQQRHPFLAQKRQRIAFGTKSFWCVVAFAIDQVGDNKLKQLQHTLC